MVEKICKILMRRDGISYNEAREIVQECMEEIMQCIAEGKYDMAEESVKYWLGLEPDYLEILLNEMF